MKHFFLYLFFLFLLSTGALAVGVSPAKYEFDFQAGFENDFKFVVTNNAGKDVNMEVKIGNDLAEYATVDRDFFFVPAGGKATFYVHLALPETVEQAGTNILKVKIAEKPLANSGGMSSTTAVIPYIIVHVPYPGKYAHIQSFTAGGELRGVNEGENVPSVFKIKNLGDENLTDLRAKVFIREMDGTLIDTINFPQTLVTPQKVYSESFEIETKDYLPNDYQAVLKIYYTDLENKLVEKNRSVKFRIGNFDAEVISTPKNLTKGGIVEFPIVIKNKWKGGLHIDVELKVPGADISKSPRFTAKDFQQFTLKNYLDTTNLELGEHNGTVTLNFENSKNPSETDSKEVPITFNLIEKEELKKDSNISLSGTTILISIMGVLLLAVIIILIIVLKGHGRKENK